MTELLEMPVVTTKTTKAQLEAQLRETVFKHNTAVSEHESFKNLVYVTALEQKEQQGWCDEGFADSMKTLGIKTPSQFRRVTIVVDVDLYDSKGPFNLTSSDLDEYEDQDVTDGVLEALNNSFYDRETVHTLKVEALDEKPEKLLVEKVRRRTSNSYYSENTDF